MLNSIESNGEVEAVSLSLNVTWVPLLVVFLPAGLLYTRY